MKEAIIKICPDGQIQMIYNEELNLQELGKTSIERASHVEPLENGYWYADMSPVGGPMLLGPDEKGFKTRSEALEAETRYINENILQGGIVKCRN